MIQSALQTVIQTQQNQLPIYRIAAFQQDSSLVHAIFTRQGGVSRGAFQSLNLSISVGDDPAAVQANLKLACQTLGIEAAQTVACHLVHSANVVTVTPGNRQPVMGYADGLITATPDLFLFMRFGDCTPLIFFDPVRRAVGLAHAGWRGTMQNVAGATVQAMTTDLGCQPQNIIAAIGPAIGPCCYEVGPAVIAAANAAFDNPTGLLHPNGRPNHAYFDLWAANRRQLAAAGVEQIIQTDLCTACHTNEFFSHRAEAGHTGRFGVIIGLREPAA